MDNKAVLRQKLQAMKMKRAPRNTIIKKQEKQQEKQDKDTSKDASKEKNISIDSELPPLEDY